MFKEAISNYIDRLCNQQQLQVPCGWDGFRCVLFDMDGVLYNSMPRHAVAWQEAMKKYGEAAIVEMVMDALPEIARNVAEPLSKVDKITMYGEGNSAKLLSDIVNGTTQVTEGFTAGMGLDIKALVAGLLGGKLASNDCDPPAPTVINITAPEAKPEPPVQPDPVE